MAHRHHGNYQAKHPSDQRVPNHVRTALKKAITHSAITCEVAHAVAKELGAAPQEVGIGIDLLNARVTTCQLGLFEKHASPQGEPQSNHPSPDLAKTIREAIQDNGLACIQAWRIADRLGLPRRHVGDACNAIGVKIRHCQLGTF